MTQFSLMKNVCMATFVWVVLACAQGRTATLIVTNINDSGPGSLRQAILTANASAVPDTIHFAIPGPGVHTITLAALLPEIARPLTIDGYTQPGSSPNSLSDANNAVLLIEISGNNTFDGLIFRTGSSNSLVRGLVLNQFIRAIHFTGINAFTGANAVEGCFIGTDPAGRATKGFNSQAGVQTVGSVGNRVGGTTPATRNVIACSTGNGIQIDNAVSNVIQGNFIGVDVAGTNAIGGHSNGIFLNNAAHNTTVGGPGTAARNIIVGTGGNGIRSDNSSGHVIQGNFIGTDVTGTRLLGGWSFGVDLGTSPGGVVGGPTVSPGVPPGNVIGGGLFGIKLFNQAVVQGNLIGTDVTGTRDLGSALDGIAMDGVINCIIGGTNVVERNIISGHNRRGIAVDTVSATNLIQGNFIGTDITGVHPVPNSVSGIYLGSGRDNLIVSNLIAFNADDGITSDSTGVRNRITANSIFGNGSAIGGLAIDLGFNGVLANDPGDADSGANQFQNFPVITGVSLAGGSVTLSGALNSASNSAYRLEFFSNLSCDNGGHGEGQTFLGSTNVTTDSVGDASFLVTLAHVGGAVFTATATDTNGNTSEFSACASVAGPCVITCPSNLVVSTAPNQCGASVTFFPSTSGNCGGVSCSPPSGSLFPKGVTTVTCTAASGPNCSFTVTVNDTVGPTVTCPANIVSNVPPGQTSAVVNYPPPVVTDNCGVSSTNCSPASGSVFTLGVTTVTCIAIDTANVTNSCNFTVSVTTTNTPPIAQCRDVTTSANEDCEADVPAAAVDNGSFDPDGTIVSRNLVPSGPYPPGTNQVTLTVVDDRGGSNACSATIVVRDVTVPTVTCPGDIVTNIPRGEVAVVVNYPLPTSNDNCSATLTVSCTPPPGSQFPLGTTRVVCSVSDPSGNTNTCRFNVTANSVSLGLVWDGGGANGFWTNAANWVGNILPVNGDGLVFPTNAARTANTNTLGGPTNLAFLELSGSNYAIFGPRLTLLNGLTNLPPFLGSNAIHAPITVAGDQTWHLGPFAEKTTLSLLGDLSLASFQLTVNADNGMMQVFGDVLGAAGSQLLVTGGGQVRLFGEDTFIPEVRVTDGTLVVDGVLAGALFIEEDGTLHGSGGVPPFRSAGRVAPGGAANPGVLTVLPGSAEFLAGSTLVIDLMDAAPPGTGHDQLRVSTPPNLAGATLTVSRFFRPLIGQTFVIVTNTGSAPFTTTFVGKPEGSTFLVQNTRCRITYTGGNGNDIVLIVDGYEASGLTRIWSGDGTNSLWSNRFNWVGNTLPDQGDNLLFPPGVVASRLANTNDFPPGAVFNSITLTTPGYALRGNAVRLIDGIHGAYDTPSSLISFPILLTRPQTFTNQAAQINFFGPELDNGGHDLTVHVEGGTVLFGSSLLLHGAGGLIKEGPGVLRMAAGTDMTYLGATHVLGGVLELAGASGVTLIPGELVIGDDEGGPGSDVVRLVAQNMIANGNAVTIATSGVLDTAGRAETIGTLSGSGALIVGNSFVSEVTGVSMFSGTISGTAGAFIKSGPGTLIFTGTNTHTGLMQCQQGTFQVDGVQLAPLTRVTSGGRLQGSGLIGDLDINGSGARIAPGAGPGILTCSNYHGDGIGTATLEIELNGPVPGSGYDQLIVRGTVTLTDQTLSASLNFASSLGNQFVIINNRGSVAVIGTFTGRPENSTFTIGGEQFRISYVGGDGNDVVLTQISGIPATPPRLNIELVSPALLRLFWPTSPPGFNLEGNTNLLNTNGWLATAPPPRVVGTNNVVTNGVTELQKFYRLKKD